MRYVIIRMFAGSASRFNDDSADLVEIDPEGPAVRALNPLGGMTRYADETAVDLVHYMSVDDLNQVLYIDSTE